MNQEKIGQFLKSLRKKHNLTQKQFADKYNVTYQAVSKWENGLNMPDTALMKQISEDFGLSIDELLSGEYKKTTQKQRNILVIVSIIFVIILITILMIIFKPFSKEKDFQFKTLSTACQNFNITGTIAYNKNKSAIYITNIQYCGGNDTTEYKSIECTLYEKNDNIEKQISSFKSNQEKIKLEQFLQDVTLSVDNYTSTCKEYEHNNLYLTIKATDYNAKTTIYKIPLKLENCTSSN